LNIAGIEWIAAVTALDDMVAENANRFARRVVRPPATPDFAATPAHANEPADQRAPF
jgi:hypothetical protein